MRKLQLHQRLQWILLFSVTDKLLWIYFKYVNTFPLKGTVSKPSIQVPRVMFITHFAYPQDINGKRSLKRFLSVLIIGSSVLHSKLQRKVIYYQQNSWSGVFSIWSFSHGHCVCAQHEIKSKALQPAGFKWHLLSPELSSSPDARIVWQYVGVSKRCRHPTLVFPWHCCQWRKPTQQKQRLVFASLCNLLPCDCVMKPNQDLTFASLLLKNAFFCLCKFRVREVYIT